MGGNDTLIGNAGSDTLNGGTGNDMLQGSAGNDTYLIARGDGQDTIIDIDATAGNIDRIQYAADILPAQVKATRSGNNLVLSLIGTSDQVTVANYFENDGATPSSVEQIEFLAEGTVWDVNTVKSLVLVPTAGNDTLTGYATDDLLNGLGGDDVIRGAGGNDTLDGGPGNDTLYGEDGTDTYVYARGSGQDTIVNGSLDSAGTTDVISFSADILPSDIVPSRFSNDLILSIAGSADQLQIRDYYLGGVNVVEEIRFVDGTVWTEQTINSLVGIIGTEGRDSLVGSSSDDLINGLGSHDTLFGGAGNDTLIGGTGFDLLYGEAGNDILDGSSDPVLSEDTLSGGDGDDTYKIGRSYNLQLIDDTISSSILGGIDTLEFASDILPTDVTWTRESFVHLRGFIGPGYPDSFTSVTLWNYLLNDGYNYNAIERIYFPSTGAILDVEAIKTILTTPTEGDDNIVGFASADMLSGLGGNDTLDGFPGDDTLDGGPGDDFLSGNYGNDTYLFNRGYGSDSIYNPNNKPSAYFDRVVFGSDILPSQVTVQRTADDLLLTIGGTPDQVTVQGYFYWDPTFSLIVDEFQFSDGTSWDEASIYGLVVEPPPINGTADSDTLQGTIFNEVINGVGGNDTIHGGRGHDTIDGGLGSDEIYGDDGKDVLIAGAGERKNANISNVLHGGSGDDVLISSGKADFLYGDDGNDILLGGAGSDWLADSGGSNLMFGGAAQDIINIGIRNDLVIGGAGNDIISGQNVTFSHDLLAFNKSDGQDSVSRLGSGSTISIGGGTRYSNLSLVAINGESLELKIGTNYILLNSWYGTPGQKTVSNLQIVIEGTRDYDPSSSDPMKNQKVQVFDFLGLVSAFDAAGRPSNFNVAANLANYRLWGSDTEALGGALAYQYATTGSVDGLTYDEMRSVLAQFGAVIARQPISTGGSMAAMSTSTEDTMVTISASSMLSVSSMSTESQDTATLSALTMVEGTALESATESGAASEQVASDAPATPATNAADAAVRAVEFGGSGLLSAPTPSIVAVAPDAAASAPVGVGRSFISATSKSGQPGNGQTAPSDLPDIPAPAGGAAVPHNDDAVRPAASSPASDALRESADQSVDAFLFDRLDHAPKFDFAALADYFEQEANRTHRVLTAEQIAGSWARVRRYTEALGIDSSVEDMGAFIPSGFEYGLGTSGFESGAWPLPTRPAVGLTDATAANLKRFEGLQGAMRVLS